LANQFEEVFHLGNSIRILNDKEFKRALKDDLAIFNKVVLNIIKNLDIQKDIMVFEEVSSKANVDNEVLKEIVLFLFDKGLISFCSVLPFSENDLNYEESINSLVRLQGLGLVDQKYLDRSKELLKKTIPLINDRKYSLDELSNLTHESPIVLKELLKRFKIDWLIIDLE